MVSRLLDPPAPLAGTDADAVFRALADGTRRDILRRTLGGEHSISALAERYEMSFAAVQKHVAVLDRCGLIEKQRFGKEQLVRARVERIAQASGLLAEFEQLWRDRVGRIDLLIASDYSAEASDHSPNDEPTPNT
ncbi:helix-turn-helix domain-containing protein [Herbiconiux sp. CPCC 205716]|uniref:Helix-turn-helix domain-containing protein n=1 Tax=Herbiconiux gentiana TaxID=2970912 RepID=A0ABT2GB85_9MICO|nr:metalloregulator ArsR/SmtB family transcription factor [Herbiconiux gentiana]MCS5713458.1 helix-turn-helix domain-containing protein [Herbiconiux gentiana]